MKKSSLTFILLSFFTKILLAQSSIQEPSIKQSIYVLEDTNNNLSITDIQTEYYQKKFLPKNNNFIHFDKTKKWYWVKIIVKNNTPNNRLLLEVAETKIKYCNFWYRNILGEWQEIKNGYHLPIEEKYKTHYYQIFPLNITPHTEQVFYIYTKDNYHPLPIQILQIDEYEDRYLWKNMFYGCYFGIMCFIIFNNLVLGYLIKDIRFLLYIGVITLLILINVFLDGYIKNFIPTTYDYIHLFCFVTAISYTLSTIYGKFYLNIPKNTWIDHLLNVFIGILFCYLITVIILPYDLNMLLITQLLVITMFFILVLAGLQSYKREGVFALYYIYAYLVFGFFVFIEIFYANQGYPHYWFLTHSEWGAFFEAIILLYGLNKRLENEKKQLQSFTQEAQKKLLLISLEKERIVREQNVFLEEKIEEKTRMLKDKNEEIKAINQELIAREKYLSDMHENKDKLFSIIAHDLRSPLIQLKSIVEFVNNDEVSYEDLKFFLKQIDRDLFYISELTTNLLYWAQRQMSGIVCMPSTFDIHRLISQKIYTFEKNARDKKIQIHNKTKNTLWVNADENMIDLVLRNLLANAIKFCNIQDNIFIESQIEKRKVLIQISDTGIGMTKQEKQNIILQKRFSNRGTSNEKGVGLGLVLCQDFIQMNEGKFWIQEEPKYGKGTTFCFTLLLADDKENNK